MKDNKHPHHDLIVEWAKDTSKQPQIKKLSRVYEWEDCRIHAVISNPKFLARFKPREFIKGHWYPCVESRNGVRRVMVYVGENQFSLSSDCIVSKKAHEMKYIGESLGEIKFEGEL